LLDFYLVSTWHRAAMLTHFVNLIALLIYIQPESGQLPFGCLKFFFNEAAFGLQIIISRPEPLNAVFFEFKLPVGTVKFDLKFPPALNFILCLMCTGVLVLFDINQSRVKLVLHVLKLKLQVMILRGLAGNLIVTASYFLLCGIEPSRKHQVGFPHFTHLEGVFRKVRLGLRLVGN